MAKSQRDKGKRTIGFCAYRAWAISTGDGSFVGPFRFSPDRPAHLTLRTCVWGSRQEAREALKSVRGASSRGLYPKARVVRVTVMIRG